MTSVRYGSLLKSLSHRRLVRIRQTLFVRIVIFDQDNNWKNTFIFENTFLKNSFRRNDVGMVYGDMSHKMFCQQLGISRSQLHVWLKRDQLGAWSAEPAQPRPQDRPSPGTVARRVVKIGLRNVINRLEDWPI